MELISSRNSKLFSRLEKAIECIWLLTIFLVPLAYDPFSLILLFC